MLEQNVLSGINYCIRGLWPATKFCLTAVGCIALALLVGALIFGGTGAISLPIVRGLVHGFSTISPAVALLCIVGGSVALYGGCVTLVGIVIWAID